MPTSLVYELALNRAEAGIAARFDLFRNRFWRGRRTNVHRCAEVKMQQKWAGAHRPSKTLLQRASARFSSSRLRLRKTPYNPAEFGSNKLPSVNCSPVAVKGRSEPGANFPPKRPTMQYGCISQKMSARSCSMAETSGSSVVPGGIQLTNELYQVGGFIWPESGISVWARCAGQSLFANLRSYSKTECLIT
jgi:hypothetical protein